MFQAEDNIPIRKRLVAATHARQQIPRMVSYGFSGRKFSNGSDRPSRDWQLISAAVGQTIVAICDLPPPKGKSELHANQYKSLILKNTGFSEKDHAPAI